MTKDEALKLGLQLVATAEYLATDAEICGKDAKEERALIQRSKIAFEEALALPEQEFFVVKHYSADERPTIKGNGFDGLEVGTDREDAEKFIKWVNARISTPPQPKPKQEPVVFFKTDNGWRKEEFEKTLVKKVPLDTTPPKPHVWFDFSNVPLDTAPPKREWVGLDDEDMKELRDANFDLLYGARWAERKLREKNGG